MRIAVLSDTRLPTSHEFPGHGLGKANLYLGEGLAQKGYDVTLFAGPRSHSDILNVVRMDDELCFLQHDLSKFDVVIDGGHTHSYGQTSPKNKVFDLSHDREMPPFANPVYPSEAHKNFWGLDGKVIHHGIPLEETLPLDDKDDYLLYMAAPFSHKGPLTAVRVAAELGYKLLFVSPSVPDQLKRFDFEHVLPISGQQKYALLSRARVLLCPYSIESGGLLALEAGLSKTPVVCFNLGGIVEYVSPEYISEGYSEFLTNTEKAYIEGHSQKGYEWLLKERTATVMIEKWEDLINGKSRSG